MIAAIVAPAGVRSIARMRACLVSGRVEVFGDECADRERGLDLLVVRAAERVEALDLDFDLDFVMGSSEVMRRHSPYPLSPARATPRQGKTKKRAFAPSKSPQQRSDQTRKPVKSEQHNCSFDSNQACLRPVRIAFPLDRLLTVGTSGAERSTLSGDPVDQTCGIQQRCCPFGATSLITSPFISAMLHGPKQLDMNCCLRVIGRW
jgi:hypothetical protein